MSLRQIMTAPVFPFWLIILLFSLGLAAVIIQFWGIRRRLGFHRALLLSFFRLTAISLLISFGLNPYLLTKKEHKISPQISLLIDTSQSMALPGREGKGTRLDDAKALLLEGQKPLLDSLRETFDVKLYAFGESLRAIDSGELARLKPEGGRGVLNEALEKIKEKSSSAILFSDGNLTWADNRLKGLPVITMPLGEPEDYKDILIREVRAPGIAFRERPIPIDVVIKVYGYPGTTFPVLLKDGNKLLTARDIQIENNPAEVPLSFPFTPEEIGQHSLSISVPPQFGESLTSNNSTNFNLRVFKDKIRILMISGNPSLNYRFMRNALKNDPIIDLLSFVILRTPSNIINVPLREQSLIPFPVDTLFSQELKTFDLVIFDNFLYHPYMKPNHIESVREFVKEGGGFAMIGGPNFFGEGGYAGTPIEEILPVRFTGKEDYRRGSPSGVKLSRPGVSHPIVRFHPEEKENQDLWQEMPSLDGTNLLEPKSSGTVLLETSDGMSRPVLVVGSYGDGRVLILATDYSWKWTMGMVAKGKGNWAYLRFMERMVRWLTKDPSLDSVQITPPEKAGEAGQEMELRILLKDQGSPEKPKGIVSVSVFDPDGNRIGVGLKSTGESSEYQASFLPERGGVYKVKVETPIGTFEEPITIAGLMENLDAAPDHRKLEMVSASSGGKSFFHTDELLREIASYAGRDERTFVEERSLPLWGRLHAFLLVLLFLTAEWYLRRRWGLM